jgi:hypothetical protein
MEPKEFKLQCGDQADWRKFRRWLRKEVLVKGPKREIPFDIEIKDKYAGEIDLCEGTYDKVGVVRTDMAVYKWDYTYFMSPEDVAKLKEKPEPLVAPKSFDLSKAERVYFTIDDLRRREEEKENERAREQAKI